jgi:hypothetical protein
MVVGVIFPLHIVAGVTSVPVVAYLLATGSTVAWASFVAYMPFYLQKAEKRFPGWKGFESIWDFFDYTTTAKSYFGEFEALKLSFMHKALLSFLCALSPALCISTQLSSMCAALLIISPRLSRYPALAFSSLCVSAINSAYLPSTPFSALSSLLHSLSFSPRSAHYLALVSSALCVSAISSASLPSLLWIELSSLCTA